MAVLGGRAGSSGRSARVYPSRGGLQRMAIQIVAGKGVSWPARFRSRLFRRLAWARLLLCFSEADGLGSFFSSASLRHHTRLEGMGMLNQRATYPVNRRP